MNTIVRNSEGSSSNNINELQFHNSFGTVRSMSSCSTAQRSNSSNGPSRKHTATTTTTSSFKDKVQSPFRSPMRRKRTPKKYNWHADISAAIAKQNFDKLRRNVNAMRSYNELSDSLELERSSGSLWGRLLQNGRNNHDQSTGLLALDGENRTPLHVLLSLRDDNLDDLILNVLHLEPKAATMPTKKQRYCLHYAIANRHDWGVVGEIVEAFPEALSKLDCNGFSPLQYAMQMAIRSSVRSPPPRTYWMSIGTDDTASMDSMAEGALQWQEEQAQRWAVVHWLLLSSATHPQSSLDVGASQKPMLVDALVHAAPPAVISLLIGASVTLLSYEHKLSAFAASSLYTCITRHYPATILISLSSQLLMFRGGGGSVDVHKVRDETGMGLVAAQYISGCYMEESAGEWSLSEEVYAVLLECIKAGDIVDEDPALIDWWKKVEYLVAFCRKVKHDEERSNPSDVEKNYLLHAAMTNSDTPPLITRLMVALYPESIRKPDPWHGALPLHLACMTQDYIPRYYENFALAATCHLERSLDVVLEADVASAKIRFRDRLPLHLAIASGKTIDSLGCLLAAGAVKNPDGSLDYVQLSQRDPKTLLYPFQLAATYTNNGDHDSFRWTCIARNKFSYAVWQGKSDREKACSVLQVASSEESQRLDTIYRLLRLRPTVLAKETPQTDHLVAPAKHRLHKGVMVSEHEIMKLLSVGPVCAKYFAWCYTVRVGQRNGKHSIDCNVQNQNLLRLALRYLTTSGSLADLPAHFESWRQDIEATIWGSRTEIPKSLSLLTRSIKVSIPKNKQFLLHAALLSPDTPPEVVEFLLKQNSTACSLSLPKTSILPLHIGAASPSYVPQSWETYKKSRLSVVVEQYPQAAKAAISGRFPLHFAILARKKFEDIEALIKAFPNALSVPDPDSGFLPFQLMAYRRSRSEQAQVSLTVRHAGEWRNNEVAPTQRTENVVLARPFNIDIDSDTLSSVYSLLRKSENLERIFGRKLGLDKGTVKGQKDAANSALSRYNQPYSSRSVQAIDSSSKSDDSSFMKNTREAAKMPPRKLGSASLSFMLSQHRSKHATTLEDLCDCDASVMSNVDVMSSLTTTIHKEKISSQKVEESESSINIYSFASGDEEVFSDSSSEESTSRSYIDFAEDSLLHDYASTSENTRIDDETTSTDDEDEFDSQHDSWVFMELRRKPRRCSERLTGDELALSPVKFTKKSLTIVMDGIGVHSLSSRASRDQLAASSDKSLSSTRTDKISIPSTYSYKSLRSEFREKLNSSKSMLWMSPEVIQSSGEVGATDNCSKNSGKNSLNGNPGGGDASVLKSSSTTRADEEVASTGMEKAALLGDFTESSAMEEELFSSLSPTRNNASTPQKVTLDRPRRSSLLVTLDDSEQSEENDEMFKELSASPSLEGCSRAISKSIVREQHQGGQTLWEKIGVTMSIPEASEESSVDSPDFSFAETEREKRPSGKRKDFKGSASNDITQNSQTAAKPEKYFDAASMTWRIREPAKLEKKTMQDSSRGSPKQNPEMTFDKASMMWKPKTDITGTRAMPTKSISGHTNPQPKRNIQQQKGMACPFVSLPPQRRAPNLGSIRRASSIPPQSKRSSLFMGSTTSRTACVSCEKRDREVLMVPCRHLCLCRECSKAHTTTACPLCDRPVLDRIVIFLN